MCYCVFLASDHPFPIIPLVRDQRAFNAEPLKDDHPVKKWLHKPQQVQLGSRTWCACGLNFSQQDYIELNEPPPFSAEYTPEMWEDAVEDYQLNKACLADYFAYLRAMLALGDLEWYCCWDGDWECPPVRRLELPASALAGEPDFKKDYPLEEGWYLYYKAASPTTYYQQLAYVFNRPIKEPAWYWEPRDEETPFGEEEEPLIAFEFFEQLCVQPGMDMAPYSDSQIGLGLSYLFDGSICNLTHGFKAAPVSYERKERAVRALFALFQEVFEPRCPEKAAAGSQEKSAPLSYICYMFWDVCPLSSWLKHDNEEQINISFMASLTAEDLERMQLPEGVLANLRQQIAQSKVEIKTPEDIAADVQRQHQNMDAETRGYYEAIADVMGRCLELSNPACVESGLHGLGHMAVFLPAIAVPIIDAYLEKGKNQPAALLNYARAARTGMIE